MIRNYLVLGACIFGMRAFAGESYHNTAEGIRAEDRAPERPKEENREDVSSRYAVVLPKEDYFLEIRT